MTDEPAPRRMFTCMKCGMKYRRGDFGRHRDLECGKVTDDADTAAGRPEEARQPDHKPEPKRNHDWKQAAAGEKLEDIVGF